MDPRNLFRKKLKGKNYWYNPKAFELIIIEWRYICQSVSVYLFEIEQNGFWLISSCSFASVRLSVSLFICLTDCPYSFTHVSCVCVCVCVWVRERERKREREWVNEELFSKDCGCKWPTLCTHVSIYEKGQLLLIKHWKKVEW